MRSPIDSKCRMCYTAEEYVKHIVAKCTTLVPFEYTIKTQWTVCKHMVLQITDKCYKYVPERALNVNGITIIWDRTILANRLDIVLHDNREKTCLMIYPAGIFTLGRPTENYNRKHSVHRTYINYLDLFRHMPMVYLLT
jgi:hypothetical protein